MQIGQSNPSRITFSFSSPTKVLAAILLVKIAKYGWYAKKINQNFDATKKSYNTRRLSMYTFDVHTYYSVYKLKLYAPVTQ